MKRIFLTLLAPAIGFAVPASSQDYIAKAYPGQENEPHHAIQAVAEGQNDDRYTLKTVSLPTGVTLQYTEQGDPDGTPVILVHGFPDSWCSWQPVLPYLPERFHVYTLSLRGFGNSDKPASGYYPQDFAADIAAFIKKFELPPVVVVGHSLGAYIVMQFSAQYPELLRAIVFEGAIASFKDKKDMVEFNQGVIQTLNDPIDSSVIIEFQRSTLANPVSEEFFNTLVSESSKAPAHVWKGVWQGLIGTDLRKPLRKVKKPTLIIWGDKDIYGPRNDQQLLLKSIKGSKLVVYESTGHSVHWERPERFTKDVIQFLNEVEKDTVQK